ncbi:hypothetical protein FACS189442_6030 [Spirochaetia bacterium]|nr:hypothetical protein FACS189442_6030 [Spirochaetia bacterium]
MENMKSKVMTLGNKLAPRMGGDRKAAFVEAWAIVKAGSLEVKAAGVSFGRRPVALTRLARYNPADVRAVIVPEVDNLVDPAALKIMAGVQGGRSWPGCGPGRGGHDGQGTGKTTPSRLLL